MTIHADILPFAVAFWNADSKSENPARLALVNAFAAQMNNSLSVVTHGVSRSKAGDNIALAFSLPENRTLNRGVNTEIRNQSFSVSNKSKRVKLGMVDRRMLHMQTDAEKMAKAASMKRQNNRTPLDALQRIERKIVELLGKLEKAIRQGTDTTVIDALLLRCNYYRYREIVRLAELQVKGDERDAVAAKLLLPASEIPVFDRPIIPASIGRSYKVKRKLLKDRPDRHGEAQEKVQLASGLTVSRVIRTNGAHASKRKPGPTKAAKIAAELARIKAI